MLRRLALTLVVAAAAAAAPPNNVPRVSVAPSGEVDVVLPPSVLRLAEVRKHLASGLTTAFVTVLDARERGAVRVEIRYEPWDENYLVATLEANGRRQKTTLPTYERLVEWWSRTPLRIGRSTASTIRLKLDVVPFSATEEADAQRWLSRSLGSASATSDPSQPDASAGALLDLIIGTSVQRRPILSFRWTVTPERAR